MFLKTVFQSKLILYYFAIGASWSTVSMSLDADVALTFASSPAGGGGVGLGVHLPSLSTQGAFSLPQEWEPRVAV